MRKVDIDRMRVELDRADDGYRSAQGARRYAEGQLMSDRERIIAVRKSISELQNEEAELVRRIREAPTEIEKARTLEAQRLQALERIKRSPEILRMAALERSLEAIKRELLAHPNPAVRKLVQSGASSAEIMKALSEAERAANEVTGSQGQ